MIGRGGGGVESSSASGRGAAEGSEVRVATGGAGAASVNRGRGGKDAGGERETGEALPRSKGNSTKKRSGSSFSFSSSRTTSDGIPSGKVRLLDIAWIDNIQSTHTVAGSVVIDLPYTECVACLLYCFSTVLHNETLLNRPSTLRAGDVPQDTPGCGDDRMLTLYISMRSVFCFHWSPLTCRC